MTANLKPVDFKAVAAKGCFVYCYLSEAGDPYYIGMATNAERPYQRHACPLPAYNALVRVMRSGMTREQAADWERFYIARFGRRQDGGLLMNQNLGGEGNWGYKHTEETKSLLREKTGHGYKFAQMQATAEKYGADAEAYMQLTKSKRDCFRKWEERNPGSSVADWQKGSTHSEYAKKGAHKREVRTAAKACTPIEIWVQLSKTQRAAVKQWIERNPGKAFADFANRTSGKRAVWAAAFA
jgi:hypothetical protein